MKLWCWRGNHDRQHFCGLCGTDILELVSVTFFWVCYINFFLFKAHRKILVEVSGPRFDHLFVILVIRQGIPWTNAQRGDASNWVPLVSSAKVWTNSKYPSLTFTSGLIRASFSYLREKGWISLTYFIRLLGGWDHFWTRKSYINIRYSYILVWLDSNL